MPRGYSPKLPLYTDALDGKYALNKNLNDVVRQNLKNLILTLPGEKIMDPSFGVGLRKFLFESNRGMLEGDLEAKIRQQASKYLSYIVIENIIFNNNTDGIEYSDNAITLNVIYFIIPLNIRDKLELLVREG